MAVSDIYSNRIKVYCLISVLEYCTKIIAMAGLANRFSCKFLCRSLTHQPQIRWQTTAHTLNVRQRIQEKRDQALVGGGQKRIAAQHKKVITQVIYIIIQWWVTHSSHSQQGVLLLAHNMCKNLFHFILGIQGFNFSSRVPKLNSRQESVDVHFFALTADQTHQQFGHAYWYNIDFC